jgi:signal recognition particle subunit SRP54
MFQGLQTKLDDVFRRLRSEGKIGKEHLENALREIRLALLEADVHFRVVKSFIERVREQALGAAVLDSLSPGQQVVKIVRDELVLLLGVEGKELDVSARPAIIMLCGLQGSGKTTTAGKLARRIAKRNRYPLLVAADLQRAAAVEQLVQVGKGVGIPVVTPNAGETPLAVALRSLTVARDTGRDVVIVDTAGRLHVDLELMAEIKEIAGRLQPAEILFVADAMTGQDAVKSAGEFAAALPLTGAILTKLDGDSRGGAALSIRTVTGVPIRFVGIGEKAEDLETFYPERIASRIIGMGDVLSLIEKAEASIDKEETERLAERLGRQEFSLEDLRDQLRQIRKLGPLQSIMELLPKVGPLKGLSPGAVDDKRLVRIEAIINSMTPRERREPGLLNASRKRRIARGSGTQVQDINQLVKQYLEMRKMMKSMGGGFMKRAMGGMKGLKGMKGFGGFPR